MVSGTRSVRFGPYTLLTELGSGSYARVFKALDIRRGRMVALKVIHPDLLSDQDAVLAFQDEMQIGRWLDHPNIVKMGREVEVGAFTCLEMELVDGFVLDDFLFTYSFENGTLYQERRFGRRIPPSVVVDIAMQICEGLICIHEAESDDGRPLGLMHRDLKPANIIIDRASGVVKIMDFGIAKFDADLRRAFLTQDKTVRGSPSYMSWEQVTGKDLDQKTDLFSLGTIITEMLIGRSVFDASSSIEVMKLIANAPAAHSTDLLRRAGRKGFIPLVRSLHTSRLESRFQTAPVVRNALRALSDRCSGSSLMEWLDERHNDLPISVPDGRWGEDGVPDEVLETEVHEVTHRTSMFAVDFLLRSAAVDVVHSSPIDEVDEDEDRATRLDTKAIQQVRKEVPVIEPPTELAVPKVVPKPDLSVSIGDADFGAETADWSSIPSVGAKTDDWTAMPAGEPDDMSSLVAETEDAGEEPGLRIASLILAIAFFSMISMLLWIFATPRSPELRVDLEPTPAPDLDLATPEPTPEMTIEPMSATPAPTPVPTSRSTPAPTPRVVEREMPIVEPRRVSISEVETPSAAPEPSGTLDTATLIVSTTPPSVVWLDGNKLGVTSEQIEYQITAGPHRIRLECIGPKCPEGAGLIRENIDPGPGEEVTLLRKFKSPLQ